METNSAEEVEYAKCDKCGVELRDGGWSSMYGFACYDCGKGFEQLNPKYKNNAMMKQIQHITPNLYNGSQGAIITCEKCNDSFDLRLSFGTHEQAFKATIAAAKAYGWKISKKAVVCDRCVARKPLL